MTHSCVSTSGTAGGLSELNQRMCSGSAKVRSSNLDAQQKPQCFPLPLNWWAMALLSLQPGEGAAAAGFLLEPLTFHSFSVVLLQPRQI